MELHQIIDVRSDLEEIAGVLIRKGADFRVYTAPAGRGIAVSGDANIAAFEQAYWVATGRRLSVLA